MQITSVIKSLDKKFEQDVTAAEIFIVYNLYKLVDDEAGLAHCRSVNYNFYTHISSLVIRYAAEASSKTLVAHSIYH